VNPSCIMFFPTNAMTLHHWIRTFYNITVFGLFRLMDLIEEKRWISVCILIITIITCFSNIKTPDNGPNALQYKQQFSLQPLRS